MLEEVRNIHEVTDWVENGSSYLPTKIVDVLSLLLHELNHSREP